VKYQGPNSMIAQNIQWKPQQFNVNIPNLHESYEVLEVFFNT
jgi:hypothetical protein